MFLHEALFKDFSNHPFPLSINNPWEHPGHFMLETSHVSDGLYSIIYHCLRLCCVSSNVTSDGKGNGQYCGESSEEMIPFMNVSTAVKMNRDG